MPFSASIPIYLSGAFAGVCILIVLFSLVVGYAYREGMLWWHAGAMIAGLSAQTTGDYPTQVSIYLCALQLAFSAQALRVSTGSTGAMRRPAIGLRVMSLVVLLVAASGLVPEALFAWMLLPWGCVAVWYFFPYLGPIPTLDLLAGSGASCARHAVAGRVHAGHNFYADAA